MPFTRRVLSPEDSRRTELLSTIVSNSLPVVGVGLFGWNAAAVLFLYWFELGVDSVWALVRAVFAGRPPDIETGTLLIGPLAERQFSLSIPRTGLQVYLTTLLVLPVTVLILAGVWLFTGALLIGPLPEPSTETVTGVLLATVGIFGLTGVTTIRNYFYNGEYRKHNSTTAFRGLLPRIVTVFFGGIITLTLITAATEGPEAELGSLDPTAVGLPLVLMVVCFKFASDLLGVYSDRLAVYFKSYDAEYGWQNAPPEARSIGGTLTDAPERVRPVRWGRVLGGLLQFPYHSGSLFLGGMGLLVAVLFAIGSAWDIVAVIVVTSVSIPILLLCFDQLLRYGTVEYRIDPDAGVVVAYDRLFGTALWRIESWDERGLRVEQTPLDSLLGTETVTIEYAEGEYILPHLPDVTPVVAVFDRQPERAAQLIPGQAGLLG
ncbi:hypothetical protein Har1130_15860 [Haloarcula sp. CBA1130]|uniref:DUF6498-containing protein n=1 Tax=unclassified Haloarcula TaxID=2624677 RepID=UPI001248FA5D|nr:MULTISPECIES: DUF6498-containing protein [unclassified Haloarcula]KAA9395829.1 hypothetical protein Har1129_18055 [Haloarcula sp. CBA1129]KAA9400241.1 hypothetical protein Har1130_15860 [Haloarcula sp. CBA1130]